MHADGWLYKALNTIYLLRRRALCILSYSLYGHSKRDNLTFHWAQYINIIT